MRTLISFLLLSFWTASTLGQQAPPTLNVRTVVDANNVISVGGSKIEMFPMERATPDSTAVTGKQVYAVRQDTASAPFTGSSLGVVFNYATQQYGFTRGEITFMMKPAADLTSLQLDPSLDAREISKTGLYAVDTQTPQGFLDVVRKLQKHSVVVWVKPTIQYGPMQPSPPLHR